MSTARASWPQEDVLAFDHHPWGTYMVCLLIWCSHRRCRVLDECMLVPAMLRSELFQLRKPFYLYRAPRVYEALITNNVSAGAAMPTTAHSTASLHGVLSTDA